MSEFTNPIEREIIGIASGKVEILAVELELVSRDSDELGAAARFTRGSSSREGQDAGGKEGRGREMHGDGPNDVEHSLATRSNSTRRGAMVLIFNVARPVVEFIRIHTTESVGPPPQERECLAETWQVRMPPSLLLYFRPELHQPKPLVVHSRSFPDPALRPGATRLPACVANPERRGEAQAALLFRIASALCMGTPDRSCRLATASRS